MKTQKATAVLYAICAVVWSVKAVLDILAFVLHRESASVFMLILSIVCAVAWCIAGIRPVRTRNQEIPLEHRSNRC